MAECLINAGANVGLRASFHDHADVTALHLAAQVRAISQKKCAGEGDRPSDI